MSENYCGNPVWDEADPSQPNWDINAEFGWQHPLGIIGAEIIKLAPVINICASNDMSVSHLPELMPAASAL